MKPAAAFSIGLWTGAAVIAAVGLFTVQQFGRARGGAASVTDSNLVAASEQVQLLEQDNARLNAEVQRLKETAAALKSNMEERTALETRRRIPFRIPSPEAETPPPPPGASSNWMEQAVATADVDALPELEKEARHNNHRALEAIALLADRDQSATLTRVWQSGVLTLPNQVDATRYLAATMEVNPDAEQLLRALASDPTTDSRLLYAAVDGIANPVFRVSLGRAAPVPAPLHFKPDYAVRMRMLESLRSSFTDDNLRAYTDQAKAELQARWAETSPSSP
jgi:cell division protein FtsB